MTFEEYQALARRTMNISLNEQEARTMIALGLTGEAGECSELIKKHIFHKRPLNLDDLRSELGDVLWYVAMLADACGLSLDEIAAANVEKLRGRYPACFGDQARLFETGDERR
jgi:NTP pyrophosphatase (non-canonical NTP hydrolase)